MKFFAIAFVTASAVATVASATKRVSILATGDVGGTGHRRGDENAHDRQRRRIELAEEKRRLWIGTMNGNQK